MNTSVTDILELSDIPVKREERENRPDGSAKMESSRGANPATVTEFPANRAGNSRLSRDCGKHHRPHSPRQDFQGYGRMGVWAQPSDLRKIPGGIMAVEQKVKQIIVEQ